MTDETDPFDAVAKDVSAARLAKEDVKARLALTCHVITMVWPREMISVIKDANVKLGTIGVTFTGGPIPAEDRDNVVGIKYGVSGLKGGPTMLIFEVVAPGQTAVSLSGHKDILTVDPNGPFPKDDIVKTIAQLVKRAALA